MQEFKQTYEKWRKLLLRTNMNLVILVFFLELIMYFIFKNSTMLFQSTSGYFVHFLAIPTALNFLALLLGFIIMKRISPDSKLMNYIPSVQLAFICMVVASTHCVFSVTLCIFCAPLFTTVIFSDKKITRDVGILCYLFLAVALLYRRYSSYGPIPDDYFFTEAIVAICILIAANIICRVLIEFQKEKSGVIQQGYIRQLEMQEQLNRDQKTGLYGYTVFINTLDKMVKMSENTKKPVALAILDIDDFKKVNDEYGHLQGDRVIILLAELMKQNNRKNLFMARFGGEEFAVIFTEDEVDGAVDFLKNLKIAFEKQKYSFTDTAITISIGIAFWKSGWTSENLFCNADTAMYASKASGKNMIKIYE